MASTKAGGFDPIKPLVAIIFIAALVTGGFAFKFYREYEDWDRRLTADLQNWQGYDAERDPVKLQSSRYEVSVRDRMRQILEKISELPPEVVSTQDPYRNIGTFLTERASSNGLELGKYEERADRRREREEMRYSFELKGFTREQLVNFLYDVETRRPVLKTLEISNFRQADPKSDDFTEWDCKVVMAYRRATGDDE